MKSLAWVLGLLALAGNAQGDDEKSGTNQSSKAKPASESGAILLVPSELKWTADPKRPGTAMALAEGDPSKGPAHFYLKYEKGFVGGPHHHTNDHGGWILQGTVILELDGTDTKLPPGSFYFVRGNKIHVAKCDAGAECVMTVDVRGKWDAIPDPRTK